MDRRIVRFFALTVLLASTLLSGSSVVRGQPAEAQFGAAAVELSRSGKVGGYALSEPPGYPGARCRYDATGNSGDGSVTLSHITRPTVTSHTDYPSGQIVTVTSKAYQKRADGSLQLIETYGQAATSADSDPTPIIPFSFALSAGPTYILAYEFNWLNPAQTASEGMVEVAYTSYRPSILNPLQVFPNEPVCDSVWPPYAGVSSSIGTVNSTINYTVHRYPLNLTVQVRWDGTSIDTVHTDYTAKGSDGLKIPASPKGNHTLSFTYGTWSSSVTYTVKPRIKLIPSSVARDQTVNVSLRGFAKQETVRIRWKNGSSWVQIAQVVTSSTGSANINVKVPKFAPNGPASVRGDGNKGAAAQTNAVTVNGGPFVPATVETPTPTPSATASPTPTVSPTLTATPTAAPVEETPSATATQAPDASPVAIIAATVTPVSP